MRSIDPRSGTFRFVTSRAAEMYVSFRHAKDPIPILQERKAGGYRIISLELTSASIDIRELAVSSPDRICLVPGSEKIGVNQSLLDLSADRAYPDDRTKFLDERGDGLCHPDVRAHPGITYLTGMRGANSRITAACSCNHAGHKP